MGANDDSAFLLTDVTRASYYPTYIDGLGMRVVGKRWQRYCWKCRGRFIFPLVARLYSATLFVRLTNYSFPVIHFGRLLLICIFRLLESTPGRHHAR
jgi:hypothetical protein